MSGTAHGTRTAVAGRTEPAQRTRPEENLVHATLPSHLQRPAHAERTDRRTPVDAGRPWTDDPYDRALRTGRGPLYLRRMAPHTDGAAELLPLDVERFCAPPDAADTRVLHQCTGPVLDVGCGPGRLVAALADRGMTALGVDVSQAAVALTRRRGGAALQCSVFDPLPREGRWDTVLLMDGNIGIGGDPTALLARLRELLRPGGCLLAEAAPQDVDERLTVRVEDAHGRHGRPFPWARVGTTALLHAADATGWILTGRWTTDDRPFLELRRPNAEFDAGGPLRRGGAARPARPGGTVRPTPHGGPHRP
ncbi:methyltransferase domain-containing protein [Streptomyces ferrugineus]|uniref:Methyltransferase domain-containing protein n=1 Tax=Streptomyces ferrugineus TaxID=1413221 RepID=A0A7M2SVF9_9ACTN|nr:class I SAM-dependent methyltransferase [Streptomyces ferrugineus]QOV39665.1 methyltransferase domain-containing protein [Streptomyces ferrugineus]